MQIDIEREREKESGIDGSTKRGKLQIDGIDREITCIKDRYLDR